MQQMKRELTIAIDGYSSCGKSTFAKLIAKKLGYLYIDSGSMYRSATLYFLRKGYIGADNINVDAIIEDINQVAISFEMDKISGEQVTLLNGENVEAKIRGIEVSGFVSQISAIAEVRSHMVAILRSIGGNRGIVMDGRDIGTVVFPDADIKIFMTASVDVRAKRRFDELSGKGVSVDLEEIKNNIIARDLTDENRDISPLRRADDAVILDNSRMTIKQQMVWFEELLEKYLDEN
ncbi:MAG TPA: (d)CMP kinase [Bacteroidetes bacterium]|nr:(d)CMP kinase [Bacteroidota bacterium]